MTVSLGTVTFDKDPIWTDYGKRPAIGATSEIAIDGTEIVTEYEISAGTPITLEMVKETGWQSNTTFEAIVALAATLGWEDDLNYRGEINKVRFKHEQSGGAVQMEPLDPRLDPTDSATIWIGKIYLVTVE